MLLVLTMWMRTSVTPSFAADHPLLDGEWPDAREQVAAILRGVDARLVDDGLQEQIIHVGIGVAWRRDDGDLAGERMRAAHAVDLADIG